MDNFLLRKVTISLEKSKIDLCTNYLGKLVRQYFRTITETEDCENTLDMLDVIKCVLLDNYIPSCNFYFSHKNNT